jgi:hypothetical protein
MAGSVNILAKTTGTKAVTTADETTSQLLYFKRINGYEFVPDKLTQSGLRLLRRIWCLHIAPSECPAQTETELVGVHELMQNTDAKVLVALEFRILRTHVHDNIRISGCSNRIILRHF